MTDALPTVGFASVRTWESIQSTNMVTPKNIDPLHYVKTIALIEDTAFEEGLLAQLEATLPNRSRHTLNTVKKEPCACSCGCC